MIDAVHTELPERLEFGYSKVVAATVLVFAGGCAFGVGRVALALMGHPMLAPAGWVLIAAAGAGVAAALRHAWRAFIAGEPVVVFDADGITDFRQHPSFAAWNDIGAISRGTGETAHYLCFEFRSPETARRYVGRAYVLRSLVRRFRFLGDWNVNLLTLAGPSREVLRLAIAFHRRAYRERVASLNPPGTPFRTLLDR